MRNLRRKIAAFVITVFLLAFAVGGCAHTPPSASAWQVPQLRGMCEPGYDYNFVRGACFPRSMPAPIYAYNPPPPQPTDQYGWNSLGQQALVAGATVGAIDAGKYVASKLRADPAPTVGATEGEGAAGEGEGVTVARAVPKLAPLAGAGGVVVEAPEGEGMLLLLERGAIWIAEHPWVLLDISDRSTSPEPWRDLVLPVSTNRKA
jgi:hypothetical protein